MDMATLPRTRNRYSISMLPLAGLPLPLRRRPPLRPTRIRRARPISCTRRITAMHHSSTDCLLAAMRLRMAAATTTSLAFRRRRSRPCIRPCSSAVQQHCRMQRTLRHDSIRLQ